MILSDEGGYDLNEYKSSVLCLISCGFSHRSTITASSISDDGFTCCIQREFKNINGVSIPPQEFNVKVSRKPLDLYPYLTVAALLLASGCPIKIFKYLRF